MLFAGLRLDAWPEPTQHLAAEPLAKVLHGVLKVEIDRAHIDAETIGNLAMWKVLDMGCDEGVAPTRRQLRKRLLELLELDSGFDHGRRIGAFVGQLHDRIDFRGDQQALVAPAAILGDVERGPEQIVERAANLDRIGDAIHAQEGLVQRFTGEVCGSETASETLREPLIICRQYLTQRFAVQIGHLRRPITPPFRHFADSVSPH